MYIGLIDTDLIAKTSKFPNLALMKIANYELHQNNDDVVLLTDYVDLHYYDKLYVSKVFDYTPSPSNLNEYKNIVFGGTGFYFDKASPLPDYIEHIKPYYDLYLDYAQKQPGGTKNYYRDFAIGFITRHCFRGCPFCVNQHYKKVDYNASVEEFDDSSKKYIYLLDDNFLGYPGWKIELDKLKSTNKAFSFKQGLDIRLMTLDKAKALSTVRYFEDFIFAFDNLKDRRAIENGLKTWRSVTDARTKLYVFAGYQSQDVHDIISIFERIKILARFDCLPYLMRHKDYKNGQLTTIYNNLASWINQVWTLKSMSFEEYCIGKSMGNLYKVYKHDSETYLNDGYKKNSAWLALDKFKKEFPETYQNYFTKTYKELGKIK
jgi:hypothetical protein